jgi:two-component system OmpR family response regulator
MNARAHAMDLHSHVLIVDDDAALRSLVVEFLASHGLRATAVDGVAAMRAAIERDPPDLVVLDVMMPGEDGLTAARRLLHEQGPPVILLSALGTETDRIIGLEIGADDYLAKPCSPRELLARIRAVLRRRRADEAPVTGSRHEFAGWRLDLTRRDLHDPAGLRVDLSDGEFALLKVFVEHPQRVLSRDQLLDLVRGPSADVYDRAIDSQISRLRRKLNGRQPDELIRTVRHEGYMLVPGVTRR